MNKIEKFVTMVAAAVGAASGLWATFTAYHAVNLRQPLEEHEQVARSFNGQILSAEKRKDASEVIRIRLDYEKFEETWRSGRRIAVIVAPVEALASTTLDAKQTAELALLLKSLPDDPKYGMTRRTLGAAYLAVGEYEIAARQLTVASAGRNDPRALALRSAAFSELAKAAKEKSERSQYAELAADSFREALKSPSANVTELSGFAKASATLEGILSEQGVNMTTPATEGSHPGR